MKMEIKFVHQWCHVFRDGELVIVLSQDELDQLRALIVEASGDE